MGSDRTRWYSQLKREMELHGWSWEDLVAAVEWCRRTGAKVRYPYGVLYYVDQALEAADEGEIQDLQAKVAKALEAETDPVWVRRLSLAQGKALEKVYENWRNERE